MRPPGCCMCAAARDAQASSPCMPPWGPSAKQRGRGVSRSWAGTASVSGDWNASSDQSRFTRALGWTGKRRQTHTPVRRRYSLPTTAADSPSYELGVQDHRKSSGLSHRVQRFSSRSRRHRQSSRRSRAAP